MGEVVDKKLDFDGDVKKGVELLKSVMQTYANNLDPSYPREKQTDVVLNIAHNFLIHTFLSSMDDTIDVWLPRLLKELEIAFRTTYKKLQEEKQSKRTALFEQLKKEAQESEDPTIKLVAENLLKLTALIDNQKTEEH